MTTTKPRLHIIGLFCAALLLVQLPALAQTATSAQQAPTDNEYQVGAILWMKSSAEYRALAYQTFVLARLRLDEYLRGNSGRQTKKARTSRASIGKPAVIVDIDETVMDNSRYNAELVLSGLSNNSQRWREWCQRAEAGAVPGAVDFLNYAASRGVRVFYITNRRESGKQGTVLNLKRLGFPDVSEETVMVRQEDAPASKESRRQQVAARYRVVLLMGDNLNDFVDNFAGKPIAARAAEVDRFRVEFGSKFIVLPNPVYGDWEDAVYQYKSGLKDEEKRALRRAALKGIDSAR
jgi:5'-nucleotidase (lipoprotein e(P4) family)